jgi:hypothetical protein
LTGSFFCPSCRKELRVPRIYPYFFSLLSLALSFGIFFEIGLKDIGLVVAGFVGWFPVAAVVAATLGRLFPPDPIPLDESLLQ